MDDVTPSMPRIYLDVPYSEKDAAKAAGARWDAVALRWYAPRAAMHELAKWAALPNPLPGEDRGFGGNALFVDLVPNTCWFTNVRSAAPADWPRLHAMCLPRAGRCCEVCGSKTRLELHERWHFDNAQRIQSLRRLIVLCHACHQATHMGLAQVRGHGDEAAAHLARVNGWTADATQQHIAAAFALWKERSRFDWTLDLSMLSRAGIAVEVPATEQRVDLANAGFERVCVEHGDPRLNQLLAHLFTGK